MLPKSAADGHENGGGPSRADESAGDPPQDSAQYADVVVQDAPVTLPLRVPRHAHADDIVVDSGEGQEMFDSEAYRIREGATASATGSDNVFNSGMRRRRMGDVYPIMKNTIYSDEECDGEITLTAWDCGALFIRYLNGLFQYFVRNPKAMGLIFTTAIILLFFKYSQQVVVKAVNAAVRAHPGLEPTDILRSAVVAFTEELRGLEEVARAIGWAYTRDAVVGYDVSTAVGTIFFSLANSFQIGFAANVKTYVVYALPTEASTPFEQGHWGQIGCEAEPSSLSVCFYVDEQSTARQWNITSVTGATGVTAQNAYIEQRMPELLTVAKTAVKGSSLASSGFWTRPSMTRNIFTEKTVRTLSYLYPIAFNAEGYAVVMAGIDVSVELLMDTVNVTATPNLEIVVVDNRYNTNEGGQFMYDSFSESLFWDTPYGVREVPLNRIRDLAEPILRQNGGVLAVNGSFYQDGLIFQSLTMMEHWTLIASSPLALSVAEVIASLGALAKEMTNVAVAASGLTGDCETAANAHRDSLTVESLGQIELVFGTHLHSLYSSYPLSALMPASSSSASSSTLAASTSSSHIAAPSSDTTIESTTSTTTTTTTAGPSTKAPTAPSFFFRSLEPPKLIHIASKGVSSLGRKAAQALSLERRGLAMTEGLSGGVTATNFAVPALSASTPSASPPQWGVCGCVYASSNVTTCFYTASNQVETIFQGPIFTESPPGDIQIKNLSSSRRSNFTHQYIEGTTATKGFWTKPYLGNDTITRDEFVAVSFVYPSAHGLDGTVTRAVVLDITAASLAEALQANQHAGTTALYLIDRRDEGLLLASATASDVVNEVYPVLSTPYHELNRIANAVFSMAGGTWNSSLSFHLGPTLVNYQVMEGPWGVIEVIPGDVALERYLPTPAVSGATDALRLLPLGETVELFLYVGGILFIYFLNLLILGCSHLGA